MDDTDDFSRLIGDIYDASLDPARWPHALEGVTSYVGGVATNLFSQDAARKTAQIYFEYGLDPEYTKLYFEKFAAMNPLFPASLFFDVGQVLATEDIMPLRELYQTRFYKEYLQPQGYVDGAISILEKSAVSCAMLAVIRDERQGAVDETTRRRMSLVAPHVRRALLIGKVIDLYKVEAAAFADTLDGLAAVMLLVDGGGRVVHANVSGHKMLAAGEILSAPAGRLLTGERETDAALRDIFVSAEAGDAAVGAKGISVALSSAAGKAYVAHILPLTAGERKRTGIAYSAVAAMFVREAGFDGTPTVFETIAEKFRLTPAELRVLFAIVNVGGVPEVAPILGISEATVKTHLQHVFEKTGTSRQADLVKLVAGYMNPLVA